MLAYVLALVIGFGSFGFYMAAFFFPEVHRKSDFYLSGGGLFYALVLWVCAGRITGWVMLSQIASVSLLCWLGWQTLTLRRVLTSPEQQTPIPSQEELAPKFQGALQPVTNFFSNLLGKRKPKISIPKAPVGKSKDTTSAQKAPVPEKVRKTTEAEVPEVEETTVKLSPETVAETEPELDVPELEETTVESSLETVAETEPELDVPEEEKTTVESSPEVVAEVTQKSEVPAEEEETILKSSPEAVMEVPEPPIAPTTYQKKPEQNLSSKKKSGLVQQVTGLFTGFFRKSKPATTISRIPVDTAVSSTAKITMEAELEPESTVEDAFTEEITEASETTVSEIKSETPVIEDTEISKTVEPVATEFSEVDTSKTAEPIATESSEVDISETAEPIATESSEIDISEAAEPIATEFSEDDTSESLEPIPPKPPLPELLENKEKSANSDATESEKKATTKIEEIAPEVELAPPAEPLGDGDPQVRKLGKETL